MADWYVDTEQTITKTVLVSGPETMEGAQDRWPEPGNVVVTSEASPEVVTAVRPVDPES